MSNSRDFEGAIISIVSSIGSNVGVNLQKQAHVSLLALPPDERVSYFRVPLWWLGMILIVGGSIGDFIALGLGQVSLVTAVGGAATLTTNLFIARYWHQEVSRKSPMLFIHYYALHDRISISKISLALP